MDFKTAEHIRCIKASYFEVNIDIAPNIPMLQLVIKLDYCELHLNFNQYASAYLIQRSLTYWDKCLILINLLPQIHRVLRLHWLKNLKCNSRQL